MAERIRIILSWQIRILYPLTGKKLFLLNTMSRQLLLFILINSLLFTGSSIFGQMPEAITISPSDATGSDEITLTLDPSKACQPDGKGSVIGADKVYMHSAAFLIEYIDDWESS